MTTYQSSVLGTLSEYLYRYLNLKSLLVEGLIQDTYLSKEHREKSRVKKGCEPSNIHDVVVEK